MGPSLNVASEGNLPVAERGASTQLEAATVRDSRQLKLNSGGELEHTVACAPSNTTSTSLLNVPGGEHGPPQAQTATHPPTVGAAITESFIPLFISDDSARLIRAASIPQVPPDTQPPGAIKHKLLLRFLQEQRLVHSSITRDCEGWKSRFLSLY